MFKFKSYTFLIGGMDLEMTTIISLLRRKRLNYIDKDLQWGAQLSTFKEYFNDENTFVGIELIEDIQPPRHYICIDHHNDKSYKPASLQQIADLLGIILNRKQLLICANDSGYIPAMETMGANPLEISKLRKRDKKAQGVKPLDERLADKSISEYLRIQGDIICVEAQTPHFSTITDKLYPFNKLLISFENRFVYYGHGVGILMKQYQELISQKKAFYGGGVAGYFGLSNNAFSLRDANTMKEEIINTIQKNGNA